MVGGHAIEFDSEGENSDFVGSGTGFLTDSYDEYAGAASDYGLSTSSRGGNETFEENADSDASGGSGKIYYSSDEELELSSDHVQDHLFTHLAHFYPSDMSPAEGLAYCIDNSVTDILRYKHRNKLCLLVLQTWLSPEYDEESNGPRPYSSGCFELLCGLLKTAVKKPKFLNFLLKRSFENIISLNSVLLPHYSVLFEQCLSFWAIILKRGHSETYMLLYSLLRTLSRLVFDFFYSKKRRSEGKREIYSWKYIYSLRFLAQCIMIGRKAPESNIALLLYPFIQTVLTIVSSTVNVHLLPYRAQLIQILLDVQKECSSYIPELFYAILVPISTMLETNVIPNPKFFKSYDGTALRIDAPCIGNIVKLLEIYESMFSSMVSYCVPFSNFEEIMVPITWFIKKKITSVPFAYLLRKQHRKAVFKHSMYKAVERIDSKLKDISSHSLLMQGFRSSLKMSPKDAIGTMLRIKASRKFPINKIIK